jgi:hypothetical protein
LVPPEGVIPVLEILLQLCELKANHVVANALETIRALFDQVGHNCKGPDQDVDRYELATTLLKYSKRNVPALLSSLLLHADPEVVYWACDIIGHLFYLDDGLDVTAKLLKEKVHFALSVAMDRMPRSVSAADTKQAMSVTDADEVDRIQRVHKLAAFAISTLLAQPPGFKLLDDAIKAAVLIRVEAAVQAGVIPKLIRNALVDKSESCAECIYTLEAFLDYGDKAVEEVMKASAGELTIQRVIVRGIDSSDPNVQARAIGIALALLSCEAKPPFLQGRRFCAYFADQLEESGAYAKIDTLKTMSSFEDVSDVAQLCVDRADAIARQEEQKQ